MLKEYFQVCRVQTWPATWIVFMVPYLAAGGELFSLMGLGLTVFTWLIHSSTFSHNVISDYYIDLNDPSKSSHPLTKGKIAYDHAVRLFGPYLFLVELLGVLIALLIAPEPWLPLVFLTAFIASGHNYNDMSYSSLSRMAFIPISICWTAMAGYAWFLGSPEFGLLTILLLIYTWFRIHYQISISGRCKEIETNEPNELKLLGAKLKDGMFSPGLSFWYGTFLTLVEVFSGALIWAKFNHMLIPGALAALLMAVGFYQHIAMMMPQPFHREMQLKRMSQIEICFIFALIILLTGPYIMPLEAIVLIGVSLFYFWAMNKWLWQHGSHPGV